MTAEPDRGDYSVAVVIPAYNAEDCIGRAIESVLAQTMRPDEIIVVDDGSTDGTAQTIRRYEPRVQYVHQPNGGACRARNAGIAVARSRWIALLDADDEYLPQKLSRQMELMRRHPELVWSYTNHYIHTADGVRSAHRTHDHARDRGEQVFDDYLVACAAGLPTHTVTLVVERKALVEAGLFTPGLRWAQDTDLSLRLAYRHPRIGYLAEPLSIYRAWRGGSITTANRTDVDIRCDLIERHLALAESAGRLEAFRPCAISLLRRWIRDLPRFDSHVDLRPFGQRFPHLLPPDLRAQVWLLAHLPGIGRPCLESYFRIKNLILRRRPRRHS